MDGNKCAESSLLLAKKIRYHEPNASNVDGNSSNFQNPAQMKQVKEIQSTQQIERIQNKFSYGNELQRAEGIDNLDSSQSLMILVDDCLLEVFDYLKLVDLTNLTFVNKRLKKLVKFYVQTKNKFEFVPNRIGRDCINMEVLQVFLSIFGEEIQSLTLNRESFDHKLSCYHNMIRILRFIQAYCHLTELTLIGFGMYGLKQRLFSQLKSLTLDDCSVDRDWIGMRQLRTLKLKKVEFKPEKMLNCFGALKKLELIDVDVNNEDVIRLINSNQNLKSLSAVNCRKLSVFLCNAVGGLKHLEEFEFEAKKGSGRNDFLPLASLKKLKVLKLTHPNIWAGAQRLFEKFTANGITLEHLELGRSSIDICLVDSIVKMQSIKVLKLNEMAHLNESHVTSIASQLKMLEELHVKTKSTISQNGIKDIVRAANRLTCLKVDTPGFVIDVETYKSLLVTVQARKTLSKLKLTIYGNEHQLAVPSDILRGSNKTWLAVEELDRDEHHLFEDLTSID